MPVTLDGAARRLLDGATSPWLPPWARRTASFLADNLVGLEATTFKRDGSCAHSHVSAVAGINIISHAGHPWIMPRSEAIPGKEAAGLLPLFFLACGLWRR